MLSIFEWLFYTGLLYSQNLPGGAVEDLVHLIHYTRPSALVHGNEV